MDRRIAPCGRRRPVCVRHGGKKLDFDKLATVRYEQQEYVAQSDVTDVVLNFDVSGIRIVQDKNTQKMTCSYPVAKDLVSGKSAQVTTSEEGGVLTVTEKKLGFSLFRWDTDTPTLVLTVPENTASLSVSTGNRYTYRTV